MSTFVVKRNDINFDISVIFPKIILFIEKVYII